jgi:hypothetical protein
MSMSNEISQMRVLQNARIFHEYTLGAWGLWRCMRSTSASAERAHQDQEVPRTVVEGETAAAIVGV